MIYNAFSSISRVAVGTPSRSCAKASWTAVLIGNPSKSTARWHLCSVIFLPASYPGEAAVLRRLHRLGVNHSRRRGQGMFRQFASEGTKLAHHSGKRSVTAPRIEIIMYHRKRRRTMNNFPTLISGVENVLNCFGYLPDVGLVRGEGTVRPKPIPHPSNRIQNEPEGVYFDSLWSYFVACLVTLSGFLDSKRYHVTVCSLNFRSSSKRGRKLVTALTSRVFLRFELRRQVAYSEYEFRRTK